MHTGQNSIAPENSLPQLGQVRWSSVVIICPPVLSPRSFDAWYETVPRPPLSKHNRVPQDFRISPDNNV